MARVIRRIGTRPGALLGATLLSVVLVESGSADNQKPVDPAATGPSRSLVAPSPAGKPLTLLLTQAELRSVVRSYEIRTGEVLTAPIDEEEVIVRAPGMLAPMRDVSQDVPGGIVAPFWAIVNPKQAWRVFVPIPPKGPQREAMPVRAEDRADRPISALEPPGMPSN